MLNYLLLKIISFHMFTLCVLFLNFIYIKNIFNALNTQMCHYKPNKFQIFSTKITLSTNTSYDKFPKSYVMKNIYTFMLHTK